MARNEVLSRLWRPEKMEGADELTSSSSPSSFSSSSPAAAAATANSESQEEIHVLAVDDNLIDRKVIEKLLKITSCKVTAVDSGRRALQFLGLDEEKNSVGSDEGEKVDMIITDYCMPGMTGFELLKKIKSSAAFRQVPVVIMSSENILARIDSCFEEGAEDFIMKPVKLADVKRLKDSMFGPDRKLVKQETEICKRKLQVTCDNVSSTNNDPLPKTAATTPSPPSSTSSSPPSSPKSFSSSSSSAPSADLSPPTSPTTILNSQTRRLKISNYDLK